MSTPTPERPLVDPRTGDRRGQLADTTPAGVAAAISEAQQGFRLWSGLTPRERARRLHALTDALNPAQLIRAECQATGKPPAEASGEVEHALDVFRFFAGCARSLEGLAGGAYLAGGSRTCARNRWAASG